MYMYGQAPAIPEIFRLAKAMQAADQQKSAVVVVDNLVVQLGGRKPASRNTASPTSSPRYMRACRRDGNTIQEFRSTLLVCLHM